MAYSSKLLKMPIPDSTSWVLFFFCSMLIGMAKAGVKGMVMLTVPIMAAIFGGKISAGLVLPMLNFGDFFAVSYYNQHAQWKYVWRLLPASIAGVIIGIIVGYYVNDQVFDSLISIIIISSLGLLILQERINLPEALIGGWGFGSVFGLLSGFCTMIGNAAGPITSTYFLATRLPKNDFIGTAAWFYLLINLFKLPFHIFVWKSITWQSFQMNLMAIPAILLGVYVGIKIVKLLPEKVFRYFIMVMTFIIAIKLLLW